MSIFSKSKISSISLFASLFVKTSIFKRSEFSLNVCFVSAICFADKLLPFSFAYVGVLLKVGEEFLVDAAYDIDIFVVKFKYYLKCM